MATIVKYINRFLNHWNKNIFLLMDFYLITII